MTVNLSKGQQVSLTKRGGGGLTVVRMGLGWDAVKKRGLFGRRSQSIDLDASALLFDGQGALVDAVWFGQLRSKDGSVQHTGDNLTGEGEGDDESVVVDRDRAGRVLLLHHRDRGRRGEHQATGRRGGVGGGRRGGGGRPTEVELGHVVDS